MTFYFFILIRKFLLLSSNRISFSLQNNKVGIFSERASEKDVEGKLQTINLECFKIFLNDLLISILSIFF